jgi:hypothetical protein
VIERELNAGIDYYLENGLVVLTAQYLRDRGYCCTSGCRHCPYGFERENSGDQPGEHNPRAQK